MSTALRLRVAPTFELPSLDGLGVAARELDPETTSTSVLDTPDLVLTRWGAELTEEGGWRVRFPAHASIPSAPLTLDVPGPPGSPPQEALALLRGLLRGRPAHQIVRVVTARHGYVVGDDARPDVIIADEEVSVYHAQRLAGRFREVAVESDDGASPELVDAVLRRLRAAGGTEEETAPRLRLILGPAATREPEIPARPLPPEASIADLLRTAVADGVARLVRADPYVRLASDPEGVHQARVATRRMRSDLRSFRRYLDQAWLETFRAELKWLADALGGARDADVLADRLAAAVDSLPAPDQPAAQPLLERQRVDRRDAHAALRQALDSDRYLALLAAAHDAVHELPVLPDADVAAAEAVADVVGGPWKHLREDVAALADSPADQELHDVRIRAKRLRYAAETVAGVAGKPARRLARAAAKVQEVLGDHQDAIVAADWLRDAAAVSGGTRAAFAAGMLAARELAAAETHRAAWPRVWDQLDRGKVRGWL